MVMPDNKYLRIPIVVVGLIVSILAVMTLTGCKVVQPIEHTITKKDSVILREKLVPFSIQETTIEKSFSHAQVDSIIAALKQLPINSRTIYYTDPKFKTQMSFMLDSLGKLVIGCKTLEQQFHAKITEKDHIIIDQEIQIVELKKGFWYEVKTFFSNGIWFILIAFIVFTVINFIIKRLTK